MSDNDLSDDFLYEAEDKGLDTSRRMRLRFSDSNNYKIVPRADHFVECETGTFGSHCRHESELNLPEKINSEGLLKSLNELLLRRNAFINQIPQGKRNIFSSSNQSNRGIKRKFNNKHNVHVNTNKTDELMRSIYLKTGACFKMKSANRSFTPVVKFDNVSPNSNQVTGKITVEGCNTSLVFEGKIVDLINEDFRVNGVSNKKNPLIEASIFSNLLRNSLCYDKHLKKFIGRHAALSERNAHWKPFFMDKFGYLRSNERIVSSCPGDTIHHINLATPHLTHSELSESEVSVWDDEHLDDEGNPTIEGEELHQLNTPARTTSTISQNHIESDSLQFLIPSSPVQSLKPPKFPSTSLFYHEVHSTANGHVHSKLLASWFMLPPFTDFLQTPSPPTPPKSTQSDAGCSVQRSKGGMTPENVLICEKCLVGDSMNTKKLRENEGNSDLQLDAGLLGKYIFIKAFIDIEDILWEDIYEFEQDSEKANESDISHSTKEKRVKFGSSKKILRYKCMRELRIKPDILFKRRRKLSQITHDIPLNPFARQHPDWQSTESNYIIDPLLHQRHTRVQAEPDMTSDSDWDDIDMESINSHTRSLNIDINEWELARSRHDVLEHFILDTDSFSEGDDGPIEDYDESSSDSQPSITEWERTGRVRRSSSVSSAPNLILSELLHNLGRGGGTSRSNRLVYARSLYKNDLTSAGRSDTPGYKRLLDLRRRRPRECRKNLNHCVFNDDEGKFNKLLTVDQRMEEYEHHLKLYLFMVIDRVSGEMHYVPANLDVTNWSVGQNDGEIFRDVETFNKLWSVVNDKTQSQSKLLKPMKEFMNENGQYKGIEKLMLLHGLTNGSIVNGLGDISNGNQVRDNDPLFSELAPSNGIDFDRVVKLEPDNGGVPYSIELA